MIDFSLLLRAFCQRTKKLFMLNKMIFWCARHNLNPNKCKLQTISSHFDNCLFQKLPVEIALVSDSKQSMHDKKIRPGSSNNLGNKFFSFESQAIFVLLLEILQSLHLTKNRFNPTPGQVLHFLCKSFEFSSSFCLHLTFL